MQLRYLFRYPILIMKKDEICKIKIKIALPAQYYTSFPDKHPEVLYILVSIKLHIVNDMDKVHYVRDVLD